MAHDTAKKQGDRLELLAAQYMNDFVDFNTISDANDRKRISYSRNYLEALDDCIKQSNNQPFFYRQFKVLKNIYEVNWNVDFLIWHQDIFPNGAVIEVKQQSTAGSVDEKYPFVVESLKAIALTTQGLSAVFVSGGAVRQCAAEWCKRQENGRFFYLESDAELRFFLKTGRKKQPSTNRNLRQEPENYSFDELA